jgi:hypothetical protein
MQLITYEVNPPKQVLSKIRVLLTETSSVFYRASYCRLNSVVYGFSSCGAHTIAGTPTIVYWYAALIKIEI